MSVEWVGKTWGTGVGEVEVGWGLLWLVIQEKAGAKEQGTTEKVLALLTAGPSLMPSTS